MICHWLTTDPVNYWLGFLQYPPGDHNGPVTLIFAALFAGTTPQRREHEFPRELVRSRGREELLREFHAVMAALQEEEANSQEEENSKAAEQVQHLFYPENRDGNILFSA